MANQGQKDPQMGERETSPRSRPQLGGRGPPPSREDAALHLEGAWGI